MLFLTFGRGQISEPTIGLHGFHHNPPRRSESWQSEVQEGVSPRPDPPPLLVLCEGGWELQPPGRYPGRGGGRLAGEPPAPVPTQLRQSSGGVAQYDQVAPESQHCNCSVCSLQFMYKSHSISAFHNITEKSNKNSFLWKINSRALPITNQNFGNILISKKS